MWQMKDLETCSVHTFYEHTVSMKCMAAAQNFHSICSSFNHSLYQVCAAVVHDFIFLCSKKLLIFFFKNKIMSYILRFLFYKRRVRGCRLHSSGSLLGPVVCFCWHDNEPSDIFIFGGWCDECCVHVLYLCTELLSVPASSAWGTEGNNSWHHK